jgi:alanine racemase
MVYNGYERVWIELNRAALIHNIVQLKHAIHPAHLAPVIKCDAYGHGLIPIGSVCDTRAEVYMLCVAFLSEALHLRQAGITKPILVMSYCDDDIAKAVHKQIAFVVDTHEEIHELHRIGLQHQYRFDMHIKVDTGLARRGVPSADLVSMIMIAQQLPYVRVMGLCSHLASAYTPHSPQTAMQIELFSALTKSLACDKQIPPLLHIGNSSLLRTPGCSMFRVGLALYGYNPSVYDLDLRPVLSLKTRIASLRTVPESTAVGYDALSSTTRTTVIALLPVGYADGYDMRFSICCQVRVRGTNVPMLGRVGMNFIALDVTDVPGVTVGDEAMLIGDEMGVRVSDLIASAGMKNIREVVARLNPTIPRYLV